MQTPYCVTLCMNIMIPHFPYIQDILYDGFEGGEKYKTLCQFGSAHVIIHKYLVIFLISIVTIYNIMLCWTIDGGVAKMWRGEELHKIHKPKKD